MLHSLAFLNDIDNDIANGVGTPSGLVKDADAFTNSFSNPSTTSTLSS